MPAASGCDDPQLDPGQCAAGAAGMARRLVGREGRDSGSGLGQAIGRHDRPARVQRAPDEGRGDGSATQRDRSKGRWWRRVAGRVEDPGKHRRHERDVTERGVRGQCGHDRRRVRPIQHDERHARQRSPPHDADARDVAEPERQQPAGRRRQRGEPRLGAGDERGGRQDGRLRSTGRARGQDRQCGRGGIRRRRRAKRLAGAVDQRLEPKQPGRRGSHRPPRTRARRSTTRGLRTAAAAASSRRVRPVRDRRSHRPDPGDPVQRGDRRRRRRREQGDSVARLDPGVRATRSRPRRRGGRAPPTSSRSIRRRPPRRDARSGSAATTRAEAASDVAKPHRRHHPIDPTASDAEPLERPHVQDDAEPARPGRHRARASGRPRRRASRASRSCSRSPAVASPWSSGSGQRDEADVGQRVRRWPTPAAIPIPVSNSVLMTTGDIRAPRRARRSRPRRPGRRRAAGLIDERRRPRRPRAGRGRRARTRPPRRRRSGRGRGGAARPCRRRRAAASGCSTNSMSNRAIASSRSVAVARSQAPLTSSRRRDVRPDRSADRPDALDEHLGLAFRAGLDLERHEPRFDRLERRLGRRRAPERRDRRVDAAHRRRRARRRPRAPPGRAGRSRWQRRAPGRAPRASRDPSSVGRRPSAEPSTASRTSAARIVSATSPSAGSSTASPSPTRPSSSTRRRIQASRSTHIPVAVGNGRRNGILTRSATRPRMTVTAGSPPTASPIANSSPNTSASRAVPLSTRLSWRGSLNVRTVRRRGDASGSARSGRSTGSPRPVSGEHDRDEERDEQEPGVFESASPGHRA